MRSPPNAQIDLGPSWVYRSLAAGVALLLIALCVVFIRAEGLFSLKVTLWLACSLVVMAWLLRDAWRQRTGQLQFSQGQWLWQNGANQVAGTLRVHLDLQDYILVSLIPLHSKSRFLSLTTTWFHLEARHASSAFGPASWPAVRRAVYALSGPEHEAMAA